MEGFVGRRKDSPRPSPKKEIACMHAIPCAASTHIEEGFGFDGFPYSTPRSQPPMPYMVMYLPCEGRMQILGISEGHGL